MGFNIQLENYLEVVDMMTINQENRSIKVLLSICYTNCVHKSYETFNMNKGMIVICHIRAFVGQVSLHYKLTSDFIHPTLLNRTEK